MKTEANSASETSCFKSLKILDDGQVPKKIVAGSYTASSKPCNVESVFMCSLLYFQIRDWLTLEEEMLRQQAVVVGDVDDILQVLDKQKVRLSVV